MTDPMLSLRGHVEKKDTQPEIYEVTIAVYTEDDTLEVQVIILPVTNLLRVVASDHEENA